MTPDFAMGQSAAPDISLVQAGVYAAVGLIVVIFLLTLMAFFTLPLFFGALAGINETLGFPEKKLWVRTLIRLGLFGMGCVFEAIHIAPELEGVPGRAVLRRLLVFSPTILFELFQLLCFFFDPQGKRRQLGMLVYRSLRRNLLRTALTYIALFVLTGMLTLIYGLVKSIGKLTSEKEDSQLVIMTDKFSIPSQMPPGYATKLKGVIEKMPPSAQPRPFTDEERVKKGIPASPLGSIKSEELTRLFRDDLDRDEGSRDRQRFRALAAEGLKENFITWSFVVASLDPAKLTQENTLFLFVLDPAAVKYGMMSEQGLNKEDLGDEGWEEMIRVIDLVKQDKRNIVVGEDRLKIMGKKVGDEVKFYSMNYKDLSFECKIVGSFPSGSRMGGNSVMQYEYLEGKLSDYKKTKGAPHPLDNLSLNLVWVRMPNKASYQALAAQVNDTSNFNGPAVKMETFSALVGAILEPYKDIFWGLKYIVMPSIGVIMCLVIGIAITIGVRERWTEMAVMKVLGFQPWQIMGMIVSEAMLIGIFGGMLSTWFVYFVPLMVKHGTRAIGVKFSFFDNFSSPWEIVILGPLLGIAVGIIGSALPSWNARKVKVSEVFAQVA